MNKNYLKKKADDRMGWIRLFENIEKLREDDRYFNEYEICSELRLPGILEYRNGILMCGMLEDKNEKGLFTYLLRINYDKAPLQFNAENYTEDGYYFHEGVLGELLAVFSLFFGARFYLKATRIGELTPTSIQTKIENDFIYKKPDERLHKEMFKNREGNWANGLSGFLDKIIKMPELEHQPFIIACYWYSQAVKEIGIDRSIFYIKMVSCVEALLKPFKEENDDLDGKIKNLISDKFFSVKESGEAKNWLENRKISARFTNFIQIFSKGFFSEEKTPEHCFIKESELANYVKRIYISRSKYLHTGKPMYISDDSFFDWDILPSGDRMAGKRLIPEKEKLPRMKWFEQIIRHCLLSYLDDKIK